MRHHPAAFRETQMELNLCEEAIWAVPPHGNLQNLIMKEEWKMKTVQEWLQELDTEKLIQEYLYKEPIKFDQEAFQNLTVSQVRYTVTQSIREYIERLRIIPVEAPADGRQGLLYVHRAIDGDIITDSLAFSLVLVDELLEKGSAATDYAYELNSQTEIMGYLVADTPLTLRYIYELMADVLYEASFFGFEQEGLGEARQRLKSTAEEIDSGTIKGVPFKTLLDDLERETGLSLDEESEDERELHNKVIDAYMAYDQHSRNKELNAVRARLLSLQAGLHENTEV